MSGGKIALAGCGGHSRSVADVILFNDSSIQIIFVDENAREGETIYGFNVVSQVSSICDWGWVVAVGDNMKRKKIFESLCVDRIVSVISRDSYIGLNAKIGRGVFVAHSVHIGPSVEIGDNTVINTSAVIDHEVIIGAHCHIAPNSTISGRTVIGDNVFLGVGATVIDGIKICSDVVIGAGGVVVKDITIPGIYVGVPARICRC